MNKPKGILKTPSPRLKSYPVKRTRIEQEIDLRLNMRSPLVALGRHEAWGEWIRGAEPLAREIDDDARLSNVLNYLSSLHWIHGQHRKAIELGEKALNFAEKSWAFLLPSCNHEYTWESFSSTLAITPNKLKFIKRFENGWLESMHLSCMVWQVYRVLFHVVCLCLAWPSLETLIKLRRLAMRRSK